jgi:hypothetical protein
VSQRQPLIYNGSFVKSIVVCFKAERAIPSKSATNTTAAYIGSADFTHPIMKGLTQANFLPGNKTHRPLTTTFTPLSVTVASWDNGNYLVATKKNIGANNASS